MFFSVENPFKTCKKKKKKVYFHGMENQDVFKL